jgi:hypothetical protein
MTWTVEQVDKMQRLRQGGMTLRAIAETFSTSRETVGKLLNGDQGPRRQVTRQYQPPAEPVVPVKRPDVRSTAEYEALRLKRLGVPLTKIGAVTRLKYREIEALNPAPSPVTPVESGQLSVIIPGARDSCPPRISKGGA